MDIFNVVVWESRHICIALIGRGRGGRISRASVRMGALFSKKKKFWVPEHRKMADKLEDLSKWKVVEDMTGWQVQNSAAKIGEAMAKSRGTAEVNLSYNGLGDDECEALAVAIKQTRTIKRIILANNHIHELGAEVGC